VDDFPSKLSGHRRETCPTCGAPLYAGVPTPTAQSPPSRHRSALQNSRTGMRAPSVAGYSTCRNRKTGSPTWRICR
jgi:hypothetical protein